MSQTQITCPECKHQFNAEAALTHHMKYQLDQEKKRLQHEMRSWKEEQNKTVAEKVNILKIQEERLKQQQLEVDTKVSRLVAQKEVEMRQEQQRKEADNLAKLRQQVRQESLQEVSALKEELEEKSKLAALAREAQIKLEQTQRKLDEKERDLRLQFERQLSQQRVELEEAIAKRESEQHQLKLAEKDKQLEDMRKQVSELKRKSEQGSMQLQGEVQELAIECKLRKLFPQDEIQEVPKGLNGADTMQKVIDDSGKACGIMLYESKRTKHFSQAWLQKLREDQQRVVAEVAILVTEAMPDGITEFGWIDGILVCSFGTFPIAASLIRHNLIDLSHLKVAHINQDSKMALLYNYLTSVDFKMHLEEIIRTFESMRLQLDRERRTYTRQWKERETMLERVTHNTASMYGKLRGIAGAAIQEIPSLELEGSSDNEQTLLPSANQ
ncbi:DUF2130 domain-containing protein [Cesiribacter sp. SM1]|uniref:DUF2130 domain-containing protein n=1 Tax=Cesiribacter sp. SM1 TaxID=2861196 RepID=UPI001CD5C5E7|nr:DUF2130 domain-containing protein [Cesiribacter sp. SM1]